MRIIAVLLGILVICVACARAISQSACGLEPDSRRVLTAHRIIPPPLPQMHLLQIRRANGKSSLLVNVSPIMPKTTKYYVSSDHGSQWNQVKRPNNAGYTNVPLRYGPDLLRLAGNPQATSLYEFDSTTNCIDSVSMDNGKSWSTIISQWANVNSVGKCLPIGIYGEDGERVYVYVYDDKNKGVWISKDYGRKFTFLTSEVFYVVESLADSRVMYGVGDHDEILKMSNDGGRTWERLESSRVIFKPVFLGSDNVLRTWDADGHGNEDGYPYRIEQIQTDPKSVNSFYVLTCKGIFRSTNGGKTFILLPLESDKYQAIDRIAVDPVDGKYVYAQCNMNSLFRSDDQGCTWTRLDVASQ